MHEGRLIGEAQCARCGYALDGLDAGASCPECGRAEAVWTRVPARVRCVGCGYAIAGQDLAGVCPECGLGVRASLRGPLLEMGSPGFVGRLRLGSRVLVWSLIAAIALPLAWLALQIGVNALPPGSWLAGVVRAAMSGTAVEFSALGLQIGLCVGCWLVCSPDPGGRAAIGDTARRAARAGAGMAGLAALLVLGVSLGVSASRPGGVTRSVAMWVGWGAVAAWLVGMGLVFFGGTFYLRELALRVPSLSLRRLADRMVWAIPVAGVLFGLLLLCLPFVGPVVVVGLGLWLASRLDDELRGVLRRMRRSGDGRMEIAGQGAGVAGAGAGEGRV